jgi:predicted nucleotide-binding protein
MIRKQPGAPPASVAHAGVSWSSSRPRVFVGSSTEGKPIAERLHALLTEFARPRLWPSAFRLGQNFVDDILRQAHECEFGVFLMTADDMVTKRGETHAAARDNVLFELGVFLGAVGKERAFFVYSRDHPPMLPSDLQGMTAGIYTFPEGPLSDATDALRPVAVKIHDSVQRMMPISPLRGREEEVSSVMHSTITAIARSLPGTRSEDIGTHVWWLDSGEDTHLTRVLRVRPGGCPPNNWMPWRRGEGVVGAAWEQSNTVHLDLGDVRLRVVDSLGGFDRLPGDLRLRMSYDTFLKTRRDFRAIWATPIYDPKRQFLAVLSLNVDPNVGLSFSELNAVVRPAVRDLAAIIGVLAAGA